MKIKKYFSILTFFFISLGQGYSQLYTTSGGKNGLGTTSPFEKLDILGVTFLRNGEVGIDKEQLRFGRLDGDIRYHSFFSNHSGTGSTNYLQIRVHSGGGGNYKTQATVMTLNGAGNVGIGTIYPSERLEVNGTVKSKEVNVTASGWPDYVFSDGYDLKPLSEVKDFYTQNSHLPNIPNEKEISESGVNLSEMTVKLLEKIEELTIYLVNQQEAIVELKEEVNRLKLNNSKSND